MKSKRDDKKSKRVTVSNEESTEENMFKIR